MNKYIKPFRTLAALHGFYFIASGIYLMLIKEVINLKLGLGFFIIGASAGYGALVCRTNPKVGAYSGLFATLLYWFLAIMEGRYTGFINGLSVTITLMGIISLLLLNNASSNNDKNS